MVLVKNLRAAENALSQYRATVEVIDSLKGFERGSFDIVVKSQYDTRTTLNVSFGKDMAVEVLQRRKKELEGIIKALGIDITGEEHGEEKI